MKTGEKAFYFRVSGRVQGVFFRASSKHVADRYGLKGWVRNLPDGDVEGIVCGEAARLEAFREWLRRGPDTASVLKLDTEDIKPQAFDRFEVR